MTRNVLAVALALAAGTAAVPAQDAPGAIDPAIRQLFAESFVIDGALTYTRKKDPDCRRSCDTELVPLAEMTALTGVHAGTVTVSGELDRVVRNARWVRSQPGGCLVETFNDLHTARRESRYAVILYTQQVPHLDGDPAGVEAWFDAGLRIVQLAYSSRVPLPHFRARNKLAGGADEPDQGLTELGREVVARLVARHVLIDVSHCSERTTMEVIALTDVPILANHANAKALTVTVRGDRRLGRNKSDDELRAIAATGGVVGINTVGWMLDRDADGRADIEDLLAHVDYCVRLIGIDHVGLSSDAIVDGWAPDDIHYADEVLASPDRWRVVAERLRDDYGYDDAMLRKLLGGNFLRVYEAVLPGLAPPDPLSPVDAIDRARDGIVLEWQPAEARGVAPPSYEIEVEVRTDGAFVPFHRFEHVDGTSLTLTEVESGRTYRWRVFARSGAITVPSGHATFTVR